METSMAARVEALKDDFLTCPLCLQLFTEPKVLSCQHTFCLVCLKRYLEHNSFPFSQCVCPICKASASVPDGDVTRLQNNFLVTGLLQFVKGESSGNTQNADQRLPTQPPGADCPLCEVGTMNDFFPQPLSFSHTKDIINNDQL